MRKRSFLLFVTSLAIAAFGLRATPARAVTKLDITPASFTLNEGASQVVSVSLPEPVIAESGPGTGYVTVNLNLSDPARQQLSSSTLNFTEDAWTDTKTFTFTATDDSAYFTSGSMTISVFVSSNSEYYSGFTTSIPVTVVDNDTAASETPSQEQNSPSPTPAATPPASSTPKKTEPTVESTSEDTQSNVSTDSTDVGLAVRNTGSGVEPVTETSTTQRSIVPIIGGSVGAVAVGATVAMVALQKKGRVTLKRTHHKKRRWRRKKRTFRHQ